jgi:hypothetical protein
VATTAPTPGSSPVATPVAVGKVEHPTDPTAIVKKVVSVYGLGIDTGRTNPDAADFAAFELAGVLDDFEAEVKKGHVESVAVYQPTLYRAILSEFAPAGPANEWPWPDLTLDDFSASEATGLLTGVLTAEQASKVVEIPSGGISNLAVNVPKKKVFELLLRPLLPDETA